MQLISEVQSKWITMYTVCRWLLSILAQGEGPVLSWGTQDTTSRPHWPYAWVGSARKRTFLVQIASSNTKARGRCVPLQGQLKSLAAWGWMRSGSCFRKAAGEGLTVIHFRRLLVDNKEEAGSLCFPPRSLVQPWQSQGIEKREIKRLVWLQKEGEIKTSSFPSSPSGPSIWPCVSQFCCVSWCLFSLGVHLLSLWRESLHPVPKRTPALLEILSNINWQARPALPAIPAIPVLVLPGGAMGAPGTGGCSSSFLLASSE